MTLIQGSKEISSDNFYNPICSAGYLTPLQRKKMREKRNISLSPELEKETPVSNKPKSASKGIKKAKTKRTPKLKSKEKVIKKILKRKDSLPQLECSISDLVCQNKEGNFKEKRFFKNRSPQHLKKAKFIMPLTYKKGLDFISATSVRSPKCDVKERSHNNSTMETSNESIELDNCETCANQKQSNSTNPQVSFDFKVKQYSKCDSSSSSQMPENLDHIVCNNKMNLESKENLNTCDLFEFDWPSDEILLERQNKARAELRESLAASKFDSSSDNLDESSNQIEETTSTKKLFSIFYKDRKTEDKENCKQTKGKKKPLNIIDNSKGGEQLIIDAGQKEIGAKMCKTCGMIYTIGQEEDEKLHAGYHQTYLINLKFKGWKKECVIGNYIDGRVIQVKDTDENFTSKKIKDILFIVNRDLGFSTAGLPFRSNVMILLFISNDQRVNGCLVAEGIEKASRVISSEASEESDGKTIWKLGSWYASSETVRAICGVNRIWVSHEFRRQRVASRMTDCLRQCFLYGYVVDFHELAFTDPTEDGRNFASSYTGTDNFLVYK